ncbi:hypothetical protein DRQ26_00880 [bacterium]|nr:MAG: hypothetical protein DRQ26_00880 [bacterium]
MRELGEYLRQMRESRGVSLEEVAAATKVNLRYLQAIEEGQYDILPPDVYVRGFLTAYGEYLGIDPEELFTRFEADRPRQKRKLFSSKSESSAAKPTLQTATEKATGEKFSPGEIWHYIRAVPAIAYIFALAIIIVGTVIILSLGNGAPPETVSEAVLSDTTIQTASPAPKDEDIAQQILLTIDSVNAAQALSIADSLTFSIRTRQSVSIYVELDHLKKAYKGMLNPGQHKTWRVKNSLYIETSNPSALRISVNGFDLVPFEIRHPQTLEINRQNVLQLLEGYQPPPPGVSSAYGQRIESADTVSGPPSEAAARKPRRRSNTTQEDTSSKSKPRIKPPRTRNTSR